MNGLLLSGVIIVGFCRMVNRLFKEQEPVKEDKKPQYIINNVVTPIHPFAKSCQILGLEKDSIINPEVINNAFHKQLEFAKEDRQLRYKIKYSLKEYQLAKEYLLDCYDYLAFLN